VVVLIAAIGTDYVIERHRTIALVDFIAVGRAEEDVGELFQRTKRQAPLLRSLSMLDTSGLIMASSNPGNI
jgi:hypothetical protein